MSDDKAFSSGDITDLYLLGLAIANKGKLATLDSRIPAELLSGGVDHLEILSH